ncbi:hypothetical protein TNCV_3365811 [Trichonephila clavipes]|nr:hypothetical protein TNCV_3365811 [Trichonephila clavipes]
MEYKRRSKEQRWGQMVNTCHYAYAAFCFDSVSRSAILTSLTELYCQRLYHSLPFQETKSYDMKQRSLKHFKVVNSILAEETNPMIQLVHNQP